MLILKQTGTFRKWWSRLKDDRARGLVFAKLDRLAYGHGGDIAPVGEGISELRIHYGPGYRVYFQQKGAAIILLCAGDKDSQTGDIRIAKRLAKSWSK